MKTSIFSLGLYSCLGITEAEVTHALRHGIPAITTSPERTAYGYRSPLTTSLPQPTPPYTNLHPIFQSLTRAQRARLTPLTAMALHAAAEALSALDITTPPSDMALIVSCDSTCEPQALTHSQMQAHHRTACLGPHRVFQTLNSTVSMTLAEIFHFSGLTLTVSAACAGGGHAVGLAHTLIQSGIIRSALVVGAQENGLHAYTAFDALGIFATPKPDTPAASIPYLSRPFSTAHCGLVPSGGAAALVLSSSSVSSGQSGNSGQPLATIEAYGFSTSPNIITPSSESILASILSALNKIPTHPYTTLPNPTKTLQRITHIVPHATATIDGDNAEAAALATLFPKEKTATVLGDFVAEPPIPTPGISGLSGQSLPYLLPLKSLTGHECWMSGVSQLAYLLLQKKHNFLAPVPTPKATVLGDFVAEPSPVPNYSPLSVISHLPIPTTPNIPFSTPSRPSDLILLNAFGFGGTNSTLIIS